MGHPAASARGRGRAEQLQTRTKGTGENEEGEAGEQALLLDGSPGKSLPPLMRGRVHADFRHDEGYLPTLLDLVLSICRIPFDDRVVIDLRASVRREDGLWRG